MPEPRGCCASASCKHGPEDMTNPEPARDTSVKWQVAHETMSNTKDFTVHIDLKAGVGGFV